MQKTIRAATLALGACALAGFSANSNASFVFSNDAQGDGSIAITSAGSDPAFTITGSNNGTGGDTALYTETVAASQFITFTWQYASADTGGTVYDPAGYILNGVETQLSVNGGPGTGSSGEVDNLLLQQGDVFGFYVYSQDSLYGAGMLAVNEPLPPPPPPPAIPEPGNTALMMAGLATLFAAARARKNR